MKAFLRKHRDIFTSFVVTLLVLWTMLLPGYLLTLDLVFTPHLYLSFAADGGFYNLLPVTLFLKFLYLFLPGWVVEKAMLVGLFFLLSYLSLRFLPVPKQYFTRLFASLLYTANTFVYVRMLAGQWTHLYAYGLMPLFIHYLFKTTSAPSYKNNFILVGIVALIGMFSLQFFVLSLLTAMLWITLWGIRMVQQKEYGILGAVWIRGVAGLALLGALTSYWTIPAFFRAHPLEAVFNAAHWQAFAAGSLGDSVSGGLFSFVHGSFRIVVDLAMLGGFWAESQSWAQYFAWPQMQSLFLLAGLAVLTLSVVGLLNFRKMLNGVHNDWLMPVFFFILAIGSLVLATGAADTPFQNFNLFLYQHLPFWAGFRDSQKIIALLALSYAVLAGYGFAAIIERVKKSANNQTLHLIAAALFLIPVFFGMFVWGGFAKQLQPVWYPQSWAAAAQILAAHPQSKVLILPWDGYYSLGFNHNLITANTGQAYFGSQAVVSQNVRLDQVYDQSTSPAYKALDQAIRHNSVVSSTAVQTPAGPVPLTPMTMAAYLKSLGIDYIFFFQDISTTDTFHYDFLQTPGFTNIYTDPELWIYSVQQAMTH